MSATTKKRPKVKVFHNAFRERSSKSSEAGTPWTRITQHSENYVTHEHFHTEDEARGRKRGRK